VRKLTCDSHARCYRLCLSRWYSNILTTGANNSNLNGVLYLYHSHVELDYGVRQKSDAICNRLVYNGIRGHYCRAQLVSHYSYFARLNSFQNSQLRNQYFAQYDNFAAYGSGYIIRVFTPLLVNEEINGTYGSGGTDKPAD
jgi:hypothetical protein